MYEEFYGFTEKPFNLVPDPGFLYLSSKHRLALTYLEYAVMDGVGFVVLTGEIGTGKTTIIRKLLSQLRRDMEVAVVFNTNVSSSQLLQLILQEFELDIPERGKAGYLDVLNQFLITKYSQGQRVVLIIDEAQNLDRKALEEIRMISNLQSDKDLLLQILLVGQPGLRAKLRQQSLAQFRQRVAVSYHLTAINMEETREYITHRLTTAGCQNARLFTPEAIESIFRYSKGIPRTINLLCDAALVYGYADELSTIDHKVIDRVISDKREMGLFDETAEGEGIPTLQEEPRADARVSPELQTLEERVARLSAVVDWQMHRSETREENYKDRLVQKLENLLSQERKRSEGLIEKYSRLRPESNAASSSSVEDEKEPSEEQVFTFRESAEDAVSAAESTTRSIPRLVVAQQEQSSLNLSEKAGEKKSRKKKLLFTEALAKMERDQGRKKPS